MLTTRLLHHPIKCPCLVHNNCFRFCKLGAEKQRDHGTDQNSPSLSNVRPIFSRSLLTIFCHSSELRQTNTGRHTLGHTHSEYFTRVTKPTSQIFFTIMAGLSSFMTDFQLSRKTVEKVFFGKNLQWLTKFMAKFWLSPAELIKLQYEILVVGKNCWSNFLQWHRTVMSKITLIQRPRLQDKLNIVMQI